MAAAPILSHDIHVHTCLSACSGDPEAVPDGMLAAAARYGLQTIGFADHLWDAAVPGASDWYRPQDLAHISRIRAQMPADTHGVRVLIGCETEYVGGGVVGISPEAAEGLDFVLVPHSHFHMEGFVRPAEIRAPREVAELMRQRFAEVVGLEVTTGVAHPFLPCGFSEQTDEIIGEIGDGEFTDVFARAAERGVSLEITTGAFPSINGGETEGFHDQTFLRVYGLGMEAGCVFHLASDTHSLAGMGRVPQLDRFVGQLGLGPHHLHPLVRPV